MPKVYKYFILHYVSSTMQIGVNPTPLNDCLFLKIVKKKSLKSF
jgi:hypothetical protein